MGSEVTESKQSTRGHRASAGIAGDEAEHQPGEPASPVAVMAMPSAFACAPDDAGEEIASQLVRPCKVLEAGCCELVGNVNLEGIVGRDPRREQRHQQERGNQRSPHSTPGDP